MVDAVLGTGWWEDEPERMGSPGAIVEAGKGPGGRGRERGFKLARPDDLLAAFEEASFDRNRQRPDEDNPELLALLLANAEERFPRQEVSAFLARALTWLARPEVHPLSKVASRLLAGLSPRGAARKRLEVVLGKDRSAAAMPPLGPRGRRGRVPVPRSTP
jgi:hypothetical protein